MQTEIGPLADRWLPLAERWLEAERDSAIGCLMVIYSFGGPGEERGWCNLPKHMRDHFGERPGAICRLADDEGLAIAIRGSQGGWRELFAAWGRYSDGKLRLDQGDENLQRLDAANRWIFRLFVLARFDLLGVDVGGERMNLDPRFKIEVSGLPSSATETSRFKIDECVGGWTKPFTDALRESAQSFGWYAHMTDLRIASVAAIRVLQSLQADHDAKAVKSGRYGQTPDAWRPRTRPEVTSEMERLRKLAERARNAPRTLKGAACNLLKASDDSNSANLSRWYTWLVGKRLRTQLTADLREVLSLLGAIAENKPPEDAAERLEWLACELEPALLSLVDQFTTTGDLVPQDALAAVPAGDGRADDGTRERPVDTIPPIARVPKYSWQHEYAVDEWIYENIHLMKYPDLSAEHEKQKKIRGWRSGPFVRNTYKNRSKRFAEHHGLRPRTFAGEEGVNGVSDT